MDPTGDVNAAAKRTLRGRGGEAASVSTRADRRHRCGRHAEARPRLELDREAVPESIADVREAPFMARVRQSLLDAGVGDETDRAAS